MRLREELALAREGFDVLDKKREALTTELLEAARAASTLDAEVRRRFAQAYAALELARLTLGREHLEWASLSAVPTLEVEVRMEHVMGVSVPVVELQGAPPDIPYGPGDTTVILDEAVTAFRQLLAEIPRLAERKTAVWRVARELQATQRRVNALRQLTIPQFEETIAHIEAALEEREREEAFRLKRLKSDS